jgi:hypothetical protein
MERQVITSTGVIIRAVGIGIVVIAAISVGTGYDSAHNALSIPTFSVVGVIFGVVLALGGHFMLDIAKGRYFTNVNNDR